MEQILFIVYLLFWFEGHRSSTIYQLAILVLHPLLRQFTSPRQRQSFRMISLSFIFNFFATFLPVLAVFDFPRCVWKDRLVSYAQGNIIESDQRAHQVDTLKKGRTPRCPALNWMIWFYEQIQRPPTYLHTLFFDAAGF